MNGVTASGPVTAGDVRRQVLRARAVSAEATRIMRDNAEHVLEGIERRVGTSPRPQGDPWRLPAGGPRLAQRFLQASATYLRMSSGSVVLVVDGTYLGPLISGTPDRPPNNLHFLFGEGPAIEAGQSGTFIEVRDFREATWRWPAFAPAALDAGIRSAWCIPLPHPEKPGLVLAFVGREPIPYTLPRYEQLTRVTRTAQALLVDHPGTITSQMIRRHIDRSVRERAKLYQASGVLAEQLAIDCDSALGLLRLQAWSEQRQLDDISAELLASHAAPPSDEG